mgnify:CR=1 FL=1
MNIDNQAIAGLHQVATQNAEPIVPLNERMGLSTTEFDPDPEFDQFYDAFLQWMTDNPGGAKDKVQSYLKQLANPDGELLYGSLKKQMDVLTQVMVRMKEQGLEDSAVYKEISAALVSSRRITPAPTVPRPAMAILSGAVVVKRPSVGN